MQPKTARTIESVKPNEVMLCENEKEWNELMKLLKLKLKWDGEFPVYNHKLKCSNSKEAFELTNYVVSNASDFLQSPNDKSELKSKSDADLIMMEEYINKITSQELPYSVYEQYIKLRFKIQDELNTRLSNLL